METPNILDSLSERDQDYKVFSQSMKHKYKDCPSILDSLNEKDLEKASLSVSDRYYEHKYCVNISPSHQNVHQRVSFHSNRICLISLGEGHPIIKGNKRVAKVNCEVDDKTDRWKNAASGKGKRGAQKLNPDSVLCYLVCDDDSVYPVYSCIKGKLVEINENLIGQPNLVVEKPVSDGFIALLLPVLNSYDAVKNSMITKEKYLELVKDL